MGQYYRPIILINPDKLSIVEALERHVRGEDNKMVGFLYSWDYGNGNKLMEHSYIGNHFVMAVESLFTPEGQFYKDRLVWAGDYADEEEEEGLNLYLLACEHESLKQEPKVPRSTPRFIINHTKRQYVDKRKVPSYSDGYRIHPLPLLTCEGNGRGGGDYRGDSELVGTWARDSISIEKVKPVGYEELIFDLTEE